jgi:hypothetical protein
MITEQNSTHLARSIDVMTQQAVLFHIEGRTDKTRAARNAAMHLSIKNKQTQFTPQ